MTREQAVSLLCRGLTLSSVAFLIVLGAQARSWIHPDCAMYLQIGGLLLDGQVPYVDFVELNPPLVMYVSAVPVAVARWLEVPAVSVFNVMVTLFAGCGAVVWLRLLPHLAPRLSEPHRHLIANAWLAFSFLVFTAGYWALPTVAHGTDYGQREHLIVLGYVPFLLLRTARWRGARVPPRESIPIGLVAGVVLCLKPQFIVAAALCEAFLAWENGRWRPLRAAEVMTACGVGVAYALHFLFVPAAMRAAFFDRWLPLTTSRYAVYHWPWEHVFSLTTLHATVLLVVALWLPWREPYRAMARRAAPLAIFGAGSSLVMIAQHKGWPYHIIPMSAGIWLTLSWFAVEVMQLQTDETPANARTQQALVAVRAPLFIVLMAAWFLSVVVRSPVMFDRYRSPTFDLVRRVTAKTDAVTYITTAVQSDYPEALHTGRRPGSRFLWTFPIAFLFEGHASAPPYDAAPERAAEQERLLADLTEDITERQPKLVFIWRGAACQGCPHGFVIARFLDHHRFRERALSGYFLTQRTSFWDVWARDDVALPHLEPTR